MPREKLIESENDVKDKLVKPWYDARGAWHYAPIQNGMGEHGIHDRIGCVPVVVTQEMVGKKIGLFVSVEAKRPGRREEKDRGMSHHQNAHMNDINEAGGISVVADSKEDLNILDWLIFTLRTVPNLRAVSNG
mgnify:CR=1 FL=1